MGFLWPCRLAHRKQQIPVWFFVIFFKILQIRHILFLLRCTHRCLLYSECTQRSSSHFCLLEEAVHFISCSLNLFLALPFLVLAPFHTCESCLEWVHNIRNMYCSYSGLLQSYGHSYTRHCTRNDSLHCFVHLLDILDISSVQHCFRLHFVHCCHCHD